MLKDAVAPASVAVGEEVDDWKDAVVRSAQLLAAAGVVEERYGPAMISTVEELGPYVVIGPGIAIPHARPEDGALKVGISVMTLKEPVEFGSEEHDPVDLVFGFATPDADSHVDTIRDLVDFIKNPDNLTALRAARSKEEALKILGRG
jgi:mannitol/fructose-specific phosphotransferase system IIA component (Ntr-type)